LRDLTFSISNRYVPLDIVFESRVFKIISTWEIKIVRGKKKFAKKKIEETRGEKDRVTGYTAGKEPGGGGRGEGGG